MVRLTRLRIDRFRNVKPGTDLRFGATFNVLLGRNATGKTTLLDLLAAVTTDDLSAYAEEEEGFDLTWRFEVDEAQIDVHAARTPRKASLVLEGFRKDEFDEHWSIVRSHVTGEVWRAELVGEKGTTTKAGTTVSFVQRPALFLGLGTVLVAALKAVGVHDDEVDTEPAVLLIRGAMGEQMGRFDEAVQTLTLITGQRIQLVAPGSEYWAPLAPQDLREQLRASAASEPSAISFAEIASLEGIPRALGFESGEIHPRLLERTPKGNTVETTYQGLDFRFQRADGSRIGHERLSFGQKRLFAFLWYLAVRQSLPVVADELLNGLHHDWIDVCLQRVCARQSFLATQHPYLLDHLPVESIEGVQTSFVRCTLEKDAAGHDQMVWRNFLAEEAERFFVAQQTGVQHVSEILRTEGLW
jgi:hypothetical protein